MQFLAISRMRTDLFSDADLAPLLEDEAQRARTLYIEGAMSRARNLADLIQERQHRPRNATPAQIEAYLENGHFVRDLDHRLHLLEAEYPGLSSGGLQAADCEARIRALRSERSLALFRRDELFELFRHFDPKWNPAAQPMPASQMVLAVHAAQAPIINLRVTQYGTAVVAIAPAGSGATSLRRLQDRIRPQHRGADPLLDWRQRNG